ncbi:MAG: site-2 protease family protein [Nitrospirae bacterium]|nr:site-2 protease family protein [Nitrospirota bacterium]
MNGLFQGAWKIGAIMGIPIKVHFSWFIVFGLITWSLSTYYFPEAAPKLPATSYWIKGILAALLLFASVAFHELAHSFVAKRYGLSIASITLFIFGGVAHMKGEPPHPKAELRIAVAGPLSSFFLSIIFFYISLNTDDGTKALFSYLARINLILGVFNLIPGFPMDGGRVLRAIIWGKKKDFFYATRKASGIGQKIALFFIFFGIFSIFAGVAGGLWLMLIGWFLYTASQASYQQSALQEVLLGVKVTDIMVRDLVTVSLSITLEDVVTDYFLRYVYRGFTVVDDEKYICMITIKEVKRVHRENHKNKKVSDVYVPHKRLWEIFPNEDVMKALAVMIKEDVGRLVVKEGDTIVGLITRNGIAKYVQLMGPEGGLK